MTWTQFLTFDGAYSDGVWKCAGCPAWLGDNEVEGWAFVHADGCTEVAAAVRAQEQASRTDASGCRDLARTAYDARAAWLLASGLLATPWDELEQGTREMFAREAEAVAAAERERIRALVAQWRQEVEWSSHFRDCASELERLLEDRDG